MLAILRVLVDLPPPFGQFPLHLVQLAERAELRARYGSGAMGGDADKQIAQNTKRIADLTPQIVSALQALARKGGEQGPSAFNAVAGWVG